MPNSCEPSPPNSQLSEDQETQILDWLLEEFHGGTVVSKQLIGWFAQALAHRDGVEGLNFDCDSFISSHDELLNVLSVPTVPDHERTETPKAPARGMQRLTEMRKRDAVYARFGDSPPPAREPDPYPEGDIIHHCLNRYVVRHGNTCTKYTVYPHGLDGGDHPNEAHVLRFIKEHTTIPVPELISSQFDRVTMEYIEGQTLRQAWPVLTPDERSGILAQLKDYIGQLRALSGISIGRLDGRGAIVQCIFPRCGGPFGTLAEFQDWLARPPKRIHEESMYWHQITTQLGTDYPIVFTHGDIAARNIIVRDGRIVSMIDWENSGWYPEYWEYVFTLRGLDNIDWKTLGSHAPSLFSHRYDLEYILVKFILSIS